MSNEWCQPTQEMEGQLAMEEADKAVEANFVSLGEVSKDKPILLACSDDRKPTAESLEAMRTVSLPVDRPYLRIFGGKYGLANITILSFTAQFGLDYTVLALGKDYFKTAEDLTTRAAEFGVILGSHSDVKAEENPANLREEGSLACAKAKSLGQINHISETDELTIATGKDEAGSALGDTFDEDKFMRLPEALKVAGKTYFGFRPEAFSVPKGELIRTNTPTLVLADEHAPSHKVQHVYNLNPDKVSDVNDAIARGVYFYNTDAVQASEIVLRCFGSEHDLDPLVIMQAIFLDSTGTKTGLAAHDGPADPRRIKSVRYGDGNRALNYLYGVKESLS